MVLFRSISRTYRDAFRGLPRQVWLLAAVEFVNRSGMMVFFFMALYVKERLGFTDTQAGQVMTAYGVGAILGVYGGGRLSDRWGAYNVQKLSLLVSGILLFFLGQASSLAGILVLMAAHGAAGEALRPANASAVAALCAAPTRARGYALARLATNLGITFGPLVGGFLALRDYSLLFWVDGATSITAGLLLMAIIPAARPAPRPYARPGPAHPGSISNGSPWRDGPFLRLAGLFFCQGLVFSQLAGAFPVDLRAHYGLSQSCIGTLLATNTVLILAFEMILINALSHVPARRVTAVGSLMLGAGYALMAPGATYFYAVFTVVVWTFGEMLAIPNFSTLAAEHGTELNRGAYMGAFGLAFAIAMALGPGLGLLARDHLGREAVWIACGALGTLVAVALRLDRGHRPIQAGDSDTAPAQA
jgi:predicted MFS family arabinose efflux permease